MTRLSMRIAAWVGASLAGGAGACTIIAVGKDASASGHPMVTHSDDSGPMTTDLRFVRVQHKKHKKGSKRPLHLWQIPYPRVIDGSIAEEYAPVHGQKESVPLGYIPQVEETYAYWDTDYGVQNEHGLSIGESTCTAMTVGWPAAPGLPYGYNKLGIEDLSKIALERCKTARCAVEAMGPLAVEHGFYSADSGTPDKPAYEGSSEGLVIADAELGELWIFNVLTGANNASAIWGAQRVPSDHVVAVGNSFTINRMNLSDPENFLHSPDVTALAKEKGWWKPEDEEHPDLFNFFGAYGYTPPSPTLPWQATNDLSILKFYSGRRMWRIFSLLSPAEGAKLDPNNGNSPHTEDPYPPSVPAPKGTVTLGMVMDAHRDHYEGTPYDLTKGMAAGPYGNPNRGKGLAVIVGQWERAISMYRTSWSFVLMPRPNKRSLVWFGYDAAHGTAYLPFYGAATEPAPGAWQSHQCIQSKFSYDCAWWAFNLVNEYSEMNFQLINGDVRKKAHAVEAEALKAIEEWEKEADKKGEEAALKLLTEKSNKFAEKSVKGWWELLHFLYGRYARMAVTYNESATNGENAYGQAYPEWWLTSPDIGFTMWSNMNPHGKPDTGCPMEGATLPAASNAAVLVGTVATMAASLAAVGCGAYRAGMKQGERRVFIADHYVRHV